MQISLGPIQANVTRRRCKTVEGSFALEDVDTLNGYWESYVQTLPHDELAKRAAAVTVPNLDTAANLELARNTLAEAGIVIVSNVISNAVCDEIARASTEMLAYYADQTEKLVEDDMALFQADDKKLAGFSQLAGFGKTVIDKRKGQDEGMVDIFNADHALPEALKPLRDFYEAETVSQLLGARSLQAKNLNLYVNENIQKTRGFHVDQYDEKLKGFIYLTDVDSLSDGPYTYVQGSHDNPTLGRANRALCQELTPSTEAPVMPPQAITPVIAPRGSLVISDQSGIHRGWPQSSGHRRLLSVMNYQ